MEYNSLITEDKGDELFPEVDAEGNVIRELHNAFDDDGNSMYIIGSDGTPHLNGLYKQNEGYKVPNNSFDENGQPERFPGGKLNGWYKSNNNKA